MPATVIFRAKVRPVYDPKTDEVAFRDVAVPVFARRHCNMDAWRRHPKFGGLANSDLLPNILARIRADLVGYGSTIRLDRLPAGVTVDESDFLATVTITLDDAGRVPGVTYT